ncbi:MAG: metallophosphoesterase [Shewanella algae]
MTVLTKVPIHKYIPMNSNGRDFFIGDIHGEYEQLISLLAKVCFEPKRDRLFSTGDVIDRGPHSYNCLLKTQEPWFYSTLGNHENLLIEASKGSYYWKSAWFENGGEWWLQLNNYEKKKALSIIYDNFSLTMTVETLFGKIGVVHAEYPFKKWPPNKEIIGEPEFLKMLTGREVFREKTHQKVDGVSLIVSGHSESNEVLTLGDQVYINVIADGLNMFEIKENGFVQLSTGL